MIVEGNFVVDGASMDDEGASDVICSSVFVVVCSDVIGLLVDLGSSFVLVLVVVVNSSVRVDGNLVVVGNSMVVIGFSEVNGSFRIVVGFSFVVGLLGIVGASVVVVVG